MKAIDNLILYNKEKDGYLKNYLDCNDMIAEMARLDSVFAIEDIVQKKRGIITSINVADDKIVAGIETLKKELNIEDLSQLSAVDYPQIKDLKIVAGEVLKKMVDVTVSDKHALKYIDASFKRVENSDSDFDKRKTLNYTKNFFGID